MSSSIGRRKVFLIASFVAILLGALFLNTGVESAKGKTAKDEPIHIVSDRLEVNETKREIIFLGHVMAKKGDLTVLSDRITVLYRNTKKKTGNGLSDGGQIEKIVAEGNVKISKGDIVGIGDRAIYYQNLEKLILEGSPRVSRGGDFISGQRVIILLRENKSIVEGGRNEPVKATIHPKSGKIITQ